MLDKEKHQLIMTQILRDIYQDPSIASIMGFKGGTCAYFFYNLPRFSVDLDFDALRNDLLSQEKILEKTKDIFEKYGTVRESRIKRYTVFLLLSYESGEHTIKLEINTRKLVPNIETHYSPMEYLGIPMLVGSKAYLFASKLVALVERNEMAMRDIYDVWFFAKNKWDIDTNVIQSRTGKNIATHLSDCISSIEKVTNNQILQGLGELLGEKEKTWVKNHMREEAIFMLKNYISVLDKDV
jgi:predicted nucleotidyltransferase component of viral defense system